MHNDFNDHFRVRDLRASMIHGLSGTDLVFVIGALTLEIHRLGIDALAKHLLPDQPLDVTLNEASDGTGVECRVRAQRWGMSAVLHITVHLDPVLPGAVQFSLRAGSKWSPIDQTILGIVDSRLQRIRESQPQLVRMGPRTYSFDLRSLIEERIIRSGAPVRWDATLREIGVRGDRVRTIFDRSGG